MWVWGCSVLPWCALSAQGTSGLPGVQAASPVQPPPRTGPQGCSVRPAPTSPDQGGPLGWRGCVDVTLVSTSRRQGGALSAVTRPWGQAARAVDAGQERGCVLSFACSVMKFGPD